MATIIGVIRSVELSYLVMIHTTSSQRIPSPITHGPNTKKCKRVQMKVFSLEEALFESNRLTTNESPKLPFIYVGMLNILSTIQYYCRRELLLHKIKHEGLLDVMRREIERAAIGGHVSTAAFTGTLEGMDIMQAMAICNSLWAYRNKTGWAVESVSRVKALRERQYREYQKDLFDRNNSRAKLATAIAELAREVKDMIFQELAVDVLPPWVELECAIMPSWYDKEIIYPKRSVTKASDGHWPLIAPLLAGLATVSRSNTQTGYHISFVAVPVELFVPATAAGISTTTIVAESRFPHCAFDSPHESVIPPSLYGNLLQHLRHLHLYAIVLKIFSNCRPNALSAAQQHLPTLMDAVPSLSTLHFDVVIKPWQPAFSTSRQLIGFSQVQVSPGPRTWKDEIGELAGALRKIDGIQKTLCVYEGELARKWCPVDIKETKARDMRKAPEEEVAFTARTLPGEMILL